MQISIPYFSDYQRHAAQVPKDSFVNTNSQELPTNEHEYKLYEKFVVHYMVIIC